MIKEESDDKMPMHVDNTHMRATDSAWKAKRSSISNPDEESQPCQAPMLPYRRGEISGSAPVNITWGLLLYRADQEFTGCDV